MTDRMTPGQRSWNMSRIRSKNTGPELRVRSIIHRMGFRFRLHSRELPGKPDIVLRRLKTVVWVHGCFWHRHSGCDQTTMPKSNVDVWRKKFLNNVARDARTTKAIRALGWQPVIVWQCELRNEQRLAAKLRKTLAEADRRSRRLAGQ